MEKKEYVDRMWHATYPYEWEFYDEPEYLEDSCDIYNEALEEHGEVFAVQLDGVSKSHWPKVYGKEEREVDPFPHCDRDIFDSYHKSPMRIRKDGKAHRQDIKSRKRFLRGRGFKKS